MEHMSGRNFPSLAEALHDHEKRHVLRALALTHGRKAKAAALLGISRKNLWEKLRSFESKPASTPLSTSGTVADSPCKRVEQELSAG